MKLLLFIISLIFLPGKPENSCIAIKTGKFTNKTKDTIITRTKEYQTEICKNKGAKWKLHIAKTWGIGEKGKNNGILIGISKGFRQMRIQNGYGIEKRISDSQTKQIIDNYFIPNFKNGDYYKGTLDGLNYSAIIFVS